MGPAAQTRSPSARPPPPPARRQARNELKAPAAFRIPASSVKLRPLGRSSGHLHTDKTVPHADRHHDRPRRSARPLCRTLVPTARSQQAASSPPGARDRAPRPRTRSDPRPLRPPGHRHAPPDLRPSRQRRRLPGRRTQQITGRQAVRSRCALDSAADVKPEPAAGAARPWPSVESRQCTPTVLAAERRPLPASAR